MSWYCENCIEEEYEACKNSDYVSAWQMVQLESEIQQQARVTRSEAVGNLSSIKDLLTKTLLWPLPPEIPGKIIIF